MKKEPLISIITTVLNNKETIEDAIKSVLNQTYPNIEYIIVDGGSTDGTIEVINKYRKNISKFISEKDRGVYDGKGIRMATGEIIGILNSDDIYVRDNVIGEVVKAMEENNADCCWGDLVYVDAKNTDRIIRYWKSSEYKEGKFKTGWVPPHPTFFVRKWIYEKYGYFNINFPIAADYELMLRFLEKYKVKSCYIPQVMVKMRIGGQSNKILNILKGARECYKAWEINGLKVNPLVPLILRPLSKTSQYFQKGRV